MYWSFSLNNQTYYSWGQPRENIQKECKNLQPRYDVNIYQGELVKPEDTAVMLIKGDGTLGLGDSIWLISYLREWLMYKGHNKCKIYFGSSKIITDFYRNFLPGCFQYEDEYISEERFESITHKLPSIYYWHDHGGGDKSWVRNQSIISRTYEWCGIQYQGIPDWRLFSPNHIMYPEQEFYDKLGIEPGLKHVFFQWHSSGISKNLSPAANIKLLKELGKMNDIDKIYIIGRLNHLDQLNELPKVKNLANKTTGLDVFTLAATSSLIVCPDSAGLHLGEAYRIPTVAIMSTLPPVYVAYKYNIPSFIYGSGICPYKPCGHVIELPLYKCPKGTKDYCAINSDVDIHQFRMAIQKTKQNTQDYRSIRATNFYNALNEPIVL